MKKGLGEVERKGEEVREGEERKERGREGGGEYIIHVCVCQREEGREERERDGKGRRDKGRINVDMFKTLIDVHVHMGIKVLTQHFCLST